MKTFSFMYKEEERIHVHIVDTLQILREKVAQTKTLQSF